MGDVKGILTRFQASHGIVIVAFYDSRHAARALRKIADNLFPTLDGARLAAAFVSPAQVEKVRWSEVCLPGAVLTRSDSLSENRISSPSSTGSRPLRVWNLSPFGEKRMAKIITSRLRIQKSGATTRSMMLVA